MAKATRASAPPEPVRTAPIAAAPNDLRMPWRIAFALLAVLAIFELWYPLARIPAQYSINYNEGFNTQLAHAAVSGVRLYGSPPQFVYTTYPPLSFYLIGALGTILGNIDMAGRWVALLGFLASAVLAAMIVQRMTGQRRYAVYSAACFVIWIAAYKADRVGMNDPQFLGMALSMAGLYCFVRGPEEAKWLRLSSVWFVVALFTKHSLMALPLAVAVQLFLTNRKHLLTWLIAGAVVGFGLLAVTFLTGGPYFFTDLLLPRIHGWDLLMANVAFYLMFFQVPLVATLVWALWEPRLRPASLAIWVAAAGTVIGFIFCCSGGSDWNHLFDAIMGLALVAGLLLPGAEKAVQTLPWRHAVFAALLAVPFFYTSWILLPQRVSDDLAALRAIPQLEREFTAGADFLRSQQGPALCENLLLCYTAGKPMTYDNFAVEQLVKTATVPERRLLQMIDRHEYPTIQLDIAGYEPLQAAARQGFSAAFMGELLAQYRPVMRTSSFTVFVPK
jgi:Dolichyl-phosphate-mannose-protein mannosyltransferase